MGLAAVVVAGALVLVVEAVGVAVGFPAAITAAQDRMPLLGQAQAGGQVTGFLLGAVV
ncbi:hypothetical protein D3C76_1606040 [compost metagenome]